MNQRNPRRAGKRKTHTARKLLAAIDAATAAFDQVKRLKAQLTLEAKGSAPAPLRLVRNDEANHVD